MTTQEYAHKESGKGLVEWPFPQTLKEAEMLAQKRAALEKIIRIEDEKERVAIVTIGLVPVMVTDHVLQLDLLQRYFATIGIVCDIERVRGILLDPKVKSNFRAVYALAKELEVSEHEGLSQKEEENIVQLLAQHPDFKDLRLETQDDIDEVRADTLDSPYEGTAYRRDLEKYLDLMEKKLKKGNERTQETKRVENSYDAFYEALEEADGEYWMRLPMLRRPVVSQYLRQKGMGVGIDDVDWIEAEGFEVSYGALSLRIAEGAVESPIDGHA